jgi:hypothetical protein
MQARFASATSLVAVLGTGAVAAVGYAWEGQVDPVGAGIIAAFAMLTAPAGAQQPPKARDLAVAAMSGDGRALALRRRNPPAPTKQGLGRPCAYPARR